MKCSVCGYDSGLVNLNECPICSLKNSKATEEIKKTESVPVIQENKGNKRETPKKKRNYLNWVLWWKLDQEQLERQIKNYHLLKITQSARGQSFLVLIFSASITTLFIIFSELNSLSLVEVFIFLFIGYFIFKGHQWAMIGAMILWSFEKFLWFYEGIEKNPSNPPIIHLLWWSIYMHVFYFAFKIERLRNKEIKKRAEAVPGMHHFDELEKLAELRNKGVITEEEFIAKKKILLNL